jgi:hypothetical protein
VKEKWANPVEALWTIFYPKTTRSQKLKARRSIITELLDLPKKLIALKGGIL